MVKQLDEEWRPKTTIQKLFVEPMKHTMMESESGEGLLITTQGIGAANLFDVSSAGRNQTIVKAHIIGGRTDNPVFEKMKNAATTCGGVAQ